MIDSFGARMGFFRDEFVEEFLKINGWNFWGDLSFFKRIIFGKL
jgi:hypothetical protein